MGQEVYASEPQTEQLLARIIALRVSIVHGPIRHDFTERNKNIFRTIELKAKHTLADLHCAIFTAFDREDEHLYEFQFGTKPHDPRARRYATPTTVGDAPENGNARVLDATETSIGSLGLKVGQSFGYWFDFGDDWYHRIEVASISDKTPRGRYPRVTERIGASPPQYPNWDDDEEELDDDDWDEHGD